MAKERPRYIYVFTNIGNGRRYVGQTVNLKIRTAQHRRGDGASVFGRAVQRHGLDGFEMAHCTVSNLREANELEEFLIKDLKTLVGQHGYNVMKGGDNHWCSPETAAKISQALKGKKQSPEHIAKRAAANRGKKLSEKQKNALRLSRLGWKAPTATRIKMARVREIPVTCLDNGFVFRSTASAAEWAGVVANGIWAACVGRRKTSGGHRWAHTPDASPTIGPPPLHSAMSVGQPAKKIVCVDDGEVFESIGDAARAAGVCRSSMWKCLNGTRHTTGGKAYRYAA